MDIALTVGGSVLSPLLQVLFDRIAGSESFLNLFQEQRFDGRILEELRWKLLILQGVLEDAENKQSKNLAVKKWLEKLQEVVYQADDLLDQINTEALRVKVESEYPSPSNQVSASTDPSNFSIEFLKEIMPELEEIVQKLEYFERKIGILGLMKEVELKKQSFRLPSTSLVDETDVYGRDADKEKIIQALLSDVANSKNVSVISIVGLGGVGKTTLAQFVYQDERVKKQFDVKAWVCISEEYDAIRITKILLEELGVDCGSHESFNSLQVKLKQGLSEKKFLLVLDDVWNRDYNDWLASSAPFNGGKAGSKIIVTTRDEKVALMMGDRHIHHLNVMPKEDCWSLFKKHALNNRDATGNLEFESIGKEIMKKCGGLPLAVKAVAGLLRSKETIEEWNEILSSDEWDQTSNQAGILPSLRLSYTHLSSHLKRCFAFCAVFPKDYLFRKDEMILLWMANDLLEEPRSKKRREDIGDEFFHELRCRSLFQQSSDGKFSMHDLVNDLAKFVSGEYFLRLEDHHQSNGSSIVVRHLSYLCSRFDTFEKFKHLNKLKFLRTFMPINFNGYTGNLLSQKFVIDILSAFKSLKFLSFYGYRITELPNSLANLKQLRFLNLSATWIKTLPAWICTFYNLQTLLLADCKYLQQFPEDMEKLINLCYLDISGVLLMPMEIGRLENLQSISTLILSEYSGSRIEELGRLCNRHEKFTISELENVANGENASMAKMKGKKHIKKLTLSWTGDSDDSQLVHGVLENLQPNSNIEHLEINGYPGTRFSSWVGEPSFCRMISLDLSDCENCFCLPAIGQLPSLEHLTIYGLSKVSKMGQEFYGNILVTKPFPCLKKLSIQKMGEWREWYIPKNGVFSCLEELCIVDCPKLIGEFPNQLPSLSKLKISRCPKLIIEIPDKLPSLGTFDIYECPGDLNSDGGVTIFDCKVDLLQQFCSLRELWISNMNYEVLRLSDRNKRFECQHIVSLPINCLPATLKKLHISCHGNLELETREVTRTRHVSIEELIISGAINSIKDLSLDWFPNLRRLSFMNVGSGGELPGLLAPNLTEIFIEDCPKLKSLPESMHTLLPSLRELELSNCPEIECFPEGGLPSSLENLWIDDCERLWSGRREWGLQRLPSLTKFSIWGPSKEETLLPEDLLLPSTLRFLSLGNQQDLKTINYGVFQHLTSLETLQISSCPKLQSLPEDRLPASLYELHIEGCPLLKQRLEWETGEDWVKVAHIPIIEVDYELIS